MPINTSRSHRGAARVVTQPMDDISVATAPTMNPTMPPKSNAHGKKNAASDTDRSRATGIVTATKENTIPTHVDPSSSNPTNLPHILIG
ncbi:hypothetical protein [Luethyella okanaganae]|uniref:Uncharacterized protein n=1 Tax=Luethyella okanaganae TaxID=69372 RepID=A0ABW1VE28_9MICO